MSRHDERPGPDDEPAAAPAGDGADDAAHADATGDDDQTGFNDWRRRSAVGEMGTAIARGLGDIFAPSQNRQVVSAPVPGDPPDADQGFRVVLDPDDPSKSVAVFTPLAEGDEGSGGSAPD